MYKYEEELEEDRVQCGEGLPIGKCSGGIG